MVGGTFLSNVFSNMNDSAEYMVVGQNPGAEETERKEPFVGISGKMFDQLVEEVLEMKRSQFYITNTLKCLRYNARVLLEDGSWSWISHLVRTKYSGNVVSVCRDGRIECNKVIGWHKSDIAGRKMFKLSYEGAKGNGGGTVGPILTGDHLVKTKNGYKKVVDLNDNDVLAIGEPSPNNTLRDVLIGSILGDAHLNRLQGTLTEIHSSKQADYVRFKERCFRDLGSSYYNGNSSGFYTSGVRTLACRFLAQERKRFYPEGKKNVLSIESISDLMMAIWYMDDGNLAQYKGRSPSMSFATNSFSAEEVDHLCSIINKEKEINDAKRVWSNGWRIRVGCNGTKILTKRIAKFILPSLRYKLPKQFRGVPFVDMSNKCRAEKCHWESRPIVKEIVVPDKSVYCIDVAKNHNFITTGGIVVHNCYTPGNRKPTVDEVCRCGDFLDREVKILQPKAIISLGGPAFEQLTGMHGIMKHHGNPTFSPRHKVFIFPLLHPSPLNLNDPAKLELFVKDLVLLKEFMDRGSRP